MGFVDNKVLQHEAVVRKILELKALVLPLQDAQGFFAEGSNQKIKDQLTGAIKGLQKYMTKRRRLTSQAAGYGPPPTNGWGSWKAMSVNDPNYERDLRRFLASKAARRNP